MARRFVLPNLMFHMQVWGLHAPVSLWAPVDEALDRFVAALAPADQAHKVVHNSVLRTEISLPQAFGGLGIPCARAQAPIRAAEQWVYADARDTGAGRLRVGYVSPPVGVAPSLASISDGRPEAVGIANFAAAELRRLADAVKAGPARRLWSRLLEARRLHGALLALDAAPWVKEESLTDNEWCVQWYLNFGGMGEDLRARLDSPEDGFKWRGTVMEHVVADAIREFVPPQTVTTHMQPAPERRPVDHLARCRAARLDPGSWRQADIAVETVSLHRKVIDVGTINVLSKSALAASSAGVAMNTVHETKTRHYKDYYADFSPFVVSLSGGVTPSSRAVLKEIAKWAADASGPHLHWEPFSWANDMLKRIGAGMARVAGWLATRSRTSNLCGGKFAAFSRGRRGPASQAVSVAAWRAVHPGSCGQRRFVPPVRSGGPFPQSASAPAPAGWSRLPPASLPDPFSVCPASVPASLAPSAVIPATLDPSVVGV